MDSFLDFLLLIFADDMMMLCKSPFDYKRELKILYKHEYCKNNSLTENTEKTKILPFYEDTLRNVPSF